MTDDLNIWLDGVPVFPMPGGEQFSVWLDGAPVVTMGGDSATAVVTGIEIITETGTVGATGGAVATVTGSECITETGTCSITGVIPSTGSECTTETGTVVATGGAVAVVTGEECLTETGEVTVRIIPPTPPTPPSFGGYATHHHTRRNRVYKFPKSKKPEKERYRRRKKVESETVLEVETLTADQVLQPFHPSIVIARVHGSECSTKTGICNVKVYYEDDQETINLILEAMEMADRMDGAQNDKKSLKTSKETNEFRDFYRGARDEEDLEVILMVLEEV